MKAIASTLVTSIQPVGPLLVRAIRRTADSVFAMVLLLLALPLIAVLALAIRLQTGESGFYRHNLVDAHGRSFQLYRLRTMTSARDYMGKLLPDYKRVTPLGRWLYATRLYKLPSLWNVVLGQVETI